MLPRALKSVGRSSEPPYGRAAMPRPDGRARRRATSDLGGRGRVRARPLHGGSVASQRHIRHHRCWGEAYAARQGRRRPVSGPVAPNFAQNLPPAAFDRLSATDCSHERPKWPSPHAERLGTLHIHTKCKLALIFAEHNCKPLSVWVAINLESASKRTSRREDGFVDPIFVQLCSQKICAAAPHA